MYRPGRGLGLLTPLLALGGLFVLLWQRPATPLSAGRKTALRIAAGVIAALAIVAGLWFASMTFAEAEPWARWVTACFTFGVFGLPSSILAILAGAIVAKGGASPDAANSMCAIFLTISYFAQWLGLAALLLRRSMF